MATNSPPRFVPTLTETANGIAPKTTVEDVSYFEQRDPGDSMLDLDLDDLEAPISRIERVSPLGAYQGSRVVNPQAVSRAPVAPAAVTYSTATAVPQPKAPPPPQSMLPADWQSQMQALVHQAVRQELQQQMPFLLLQWSKQIEDKLTPHIHQQLVKLVQGWQASSK